VTLTSRNFGSREHQSIPLLFTPPKIAIIRTKTMRFLSLRKTPLHRYLFAALLSMWCSWPALAQETLVYSGMKVEVWAERPGPSAKQPVIIFSHGFHGCATQSRFLMEAFAAAGYIVFAPNHADATCNGGKARWLERPAAPFGKPDAWTDADYVDRADDIRRLIAAVQADARFRDRVDWSRLALAGHSLGGYTALALAGAWPSWKLSGVKAVLALSPYSQPFILRHTLGGLSAPAMYQGGTRDFGITPSISKGMGAYDLSPRPKYYVEFAGAGHFAWTDLLSGKHQDIVKFSIAFMDHYLKGLPPSPTLTEPSEGVATLRYDAEFGSGSIDADAPRENRQPSEPLKRLLQQRRENAM
jgi:pimeloyl-ACP methyl ester carboxylesterase